MERSDAMKAATQDHVRLGGRRVEYRVVRSTAARKLRVRVSPSGVEVVQPAGRGIGEVVAFLDTNAGWILNQLRRVERLRNVRRTEKRKVGQILLRGDLAHIRVETTRTRARGNVVSCVDGDIVIRRGPGSRTPIARSLENWLRKAARSEIERQLTAVTARLRQDPGRLYVMGQRTKWGNCSARRNLSFNWRLILAPEFVLRYMVAHEAVHLAVPDHSAKFWLTVQSLCSHAERARQWLAANERKLAVDLSAACSPDAHF